MIQRLYLHILFCVDVNIVKIAKHKQNKNLEIMNHRFYPYLLEILETKQ